MNSSTLPALLPLIGPLIALVAACAETPHANAPPLQESDVPVASVSAPAPTVMPAPSGTMAGLVIKEVWAGRGPAAEKGDRVQVHYRGTLEDGTEFDSSYPRGVPFQFVLGQGTVIKGWEQGILGMKTGERRLLIVPPELAYGDPGRGPIPPHSTLHFDIEMISIRTTGP